MPGLLKIRDFFGDAKRESDIHPHHPDERAHRYHATDDGSTEIEVLNFLHALVVLYKPRAILETGTYRGYGAMVLADAARANGEGEVWTVDRDPPEIARANIAKHDPDLLRLIHFHCADSLDMIEAYNGPAFDFCFFDSEIDARMAELHACDSRDLLAPGVILAFHDTSKLRTEEHGFSPLYLNALARLCNGNEHLIFPFSRGLHVVRLP